ncbi:MAG: metallophosphoesterase family protein [Bacillota bacterium]
MSKLKYIMRQGILASGILFTSIIGILVFIFLFGAASFRIYDLTWKVFVQPSVAGNTILEFPPFGSLIAQTHTGLLDVHVQLEQIGPQLVENTALYFNNQTQIIEDFQRSIPPMMRIFSLRLFLAGLMGGIILSFLVWRRKYKRVLAAGLLSALLISSALFQVYTTFNTEAFREPQYHGVISAAPNLISFANKSISKIGKIGDQANLLIDNVESLVASTDSLTNIQTLSEEGIVKKILLVSDLHSNPVAIELIKSLISSFNIDMVIDAGDLTDFGSSIETKTAQAISDLGVPYIFSPGNHETPEMVNFMSELPHVTVLKSTTAEIQGIHILGIPDPFSVFPEVETDDAERWQKIIRDTAEAAENIINSEGSPDILVSHNPIIAKHIKNAPSLIVSGHTHKQGKETLKKGNLLLNPGTTGAAGLRGLYSEGSIPYSAIILHYQVGKGPSAADFIQYDLLTQRFSLERHLENGENPTFP